MKIKSEKLMKQRYKYYLNNTEHVSPRVEKFLDFTCNIKICYNKGKIKIKIRIKNEKKNEHQEHI